MKKSRENSAGSIDATEQVRQAGYAQQLDDDGSSGPLIPIGEVIRQTGLPRYVWAVMEQRDVGPKRIKRGNRTLYDSRDVQNWYGNADRRHREEKDALGYVLDMFRYLDRELLSHGL